MIRTYFKKLILIDIVVATIAVLTLAGWQFDIQILAHPVKDGASMNPVAAILFIFCAGSKFLLGYSDINKKYIIAARALALVVLFISLFKILTQSIGVDFIDSLLYSEKVKLDDNGEPNAIPLITAFCFVLTAISLLYITYRNNKKIIIPHVLSLFILFILLLSVVAFVFDENTFYGIVVYKPMSLPSALCFFLFRLVFCL